jgi:hypothetical protein
METGRDFRGAAVACGLIAALAACLVVAPVTAQDTPADNVEILLDKIRTDKKVVVAGAMQLTEGEARAFWPVYESYQGDLGALNERMFELVNDYAAAYNSMTDEAARKLVNDYIGLEQDRVKLLQSYLPRFREVLPERKVARYYQIEHKVRAALSWGLASEIPLVQ